MFWCHHVAEINVAKEGRRPKIVYVKQCGCPFQGEGGNKFTNNTLLMLIQNKGVNTALPEQKDSTIGHIMNNYYKYREEHQLGATKAFLPHQPSCRHVFVWQWFSNMEEGERQSTQVDSNDKPTATPCGAPPVSKHAAAADAQLEDDEAAKVDVCSAKFDPLAALYSPTVSVPFPNVKCFNNVAEYESFLRGGKGRAKPENVEKRQRKARKGVPDPERIERLKKLMVQNPVAEAGEGQSSAPPRRRKQKPQKNILTRMPCRFCLHHEPPPRTDSHYCCNTCHLYPPQYVKAAHWGSCTGALRKG